MPKQVTWKIAPVNYAFLTYSQAPDGFEPALELALREIGVTDLIIGHERHQDGGHHYHVMAQWPAGYETRDTRAFDVAGCHPHYRNVRPGANAERVYQYCTKDRVVTGNLLIAKRERPNRNALWSEFIAASSQPEFLALLRERAPYEYVLQHDRLLSFARQAYSQSQPYIPRYSDFSPTDVMSDWVRNVSLAFLTLTWVSTLLSRLP